MIKIAAALLCLCAASGRAATLPEPEFDCAHFPCTVTGPGGQAFDVLPSHNGGWRAVPLGDGENSAWRCDAGMHHCTIAPYEAGDD